MQIPIELIEETALKCLLATQHDEEQWSYLWTTEVSKEFWYYTADDLEEIELDDFELDDFAEPFFSSSTNLSAERLAGIKNGEYEPSPAELAELKYQVGRWRLEEGYDDAFQAFIVSVLVNSKIEGYAVFECGRMHGFDDPQLVSAHHQISEAKLAIHELGKVVYGP